MDHHTTIALIYILMIVVVKSVEPYYIENN